MIQFALNHGSFDGGDQGILNGFFTTWSGHDSRQDTNLSTASTSSTRSVRQTARIPFINNVTPNAFYSYLPAFVQYKSSIKALHFIGKLKPWVRL